jgi:hypothetical protein
MSACTRDQLQLQLQQHSILPRDSYPSQILSRHIFPKSPLAAMDIVQAVSGYITKMVSVGDSAATGTSAAKMKILLLDNETVGLSPPPEQYTTEC